MPKYVWFLSSYLRTRRVIVRKGATGAWAPAEIWQRVPGTRPDKVVYHQTVKNAPKFRFLREGTQQLTPNYPLRKIGHPSCENPNEALALGKI